MKCAVAIFAKTIGLSQVKTRLAADIGKDNAEAFYRLSVRSVEAVASATAKDNPDLLPFWILAEKEAVGRDDWSSFPSIWTGEGELGQRLANVSEHLFENHDAVMFIGTDSPQLQPEALLHAINRLSQNADSYIAGPAEDGGFYLFVSREPVDRKVWESVQYSSSTTLKELECKIANAGNDVLRMKTEQDVDTLDDLVSLRAALSECGSELLPEQKQLLDWLDDFFRYPS